MRIWTLALLASTLCGASSQAAETVAALTTLDAGDFRGKTWQLAEFDGSPVLVVAVLGVECPLARLYAARLQELSDAYADRGVKFVGVDANRQDSLTEIAAYARDHHITFPLLKDTKQTIIEELGATRTPEVFVLDAQRRVRYHGRIDDQHAIGSKSRPAPSVTECRDAIESLLAGKPVEVPHREAVGCLIMRRDEADPNAKVTYSQQISRLLQQHCVECHRPGQIAPFSLTDYDEVVGWAEMILEVTRQGRMPPWHADPAHGKFANARGLSDEERQLIKDWVLAGAPQGNPADLPEPRTYVEGWQLARAPDMVIPMRDEPFAVPAQGEVRYQFFQVDPGLTEDKWVSAAEIVPGNRAVVHHVIVFAQSDGKKFSGDGNFLAAYVPGLKPRMQPQGMAKRLPAGSKLIFQLHYTPNGTPQEDISRIGLVFADPATVTHEVQTASVGSRRLNILPGLADQAVDSNVVTAPADVLLLALMPHMHLRGQSFRYEMTNTDGSRETLLNVPHYDFNWQTGYVLDEPRMLKAGTKLQAFALFDNSTNNLANPDPTATVTWGDQSWEEMMLGYFDLAIPRGSADSAGELRRALQGRDPMTAAKRLLELLDKNNSGKLELSEVREPQRPLFHRLDTNGDEVLDEAELMAGIKEIRQLLQR